MPRQFLLFCVAGTLGFLVDAGIVQLLVSGAGVDPLLARLPSFAAAVTTTWWFNRRYTFTPRPDSSLPAEWLRYASSQLAGLSVNYLVYASLVLAFALMRDVPALAVAMGTLSGLVVNFLAARRWAFADAPAGRDAPP
jgi:putative flippase GtrA